MELSHSPLIIKACAAAMTVWRSSTRDFDQVAEKTVQPLTAID